MYKILLVSLFFIVSNLAMGQTTWYTLASGDWSDPDIWTLDPAGAIPVNPSSEYPDAGTDNVVIKSGKVVTVPAAMNLTLGTVKVEGSLDINTSSGHTFDKLRGSGKIFLQGNGYPSVTTDDSHFTTLGRGAGTVVFEGSSNYAINTSYTFCNVEVDMNASKRVRFRQDLQINGNLTVRSGNMQFGNNSSANAASITVEGDINVENGASITVGTGNAVHSLNCNGDIINNGTIQLTNQSQPEYYSTPSNGIVVLTMQGSSNNTFTCNNTTDLYQLVINKGSDMTYVATVTASAQENFRLYGRNNDSGEDTKALYIVNGTLKLMGSVFIPTLTEGGSDFVIPTTGQLWLASSGVTVYSTALSNAETSVGGIQGVGVDTGSTGAQSLSVKGKLRITDGLLDTKSHGCVVWDDGNAVVQVEGGNVNAAGLRSAGSSTGVYSYIQSGGNVVMYGNLDGRNMEDYSATFNIKGSDNGFIMSGGTLEIVDGNYVSAEGLDKAFSVESAIGNYSVTGGTVRFKRVSGASANFYVSSTAPLYNVEINADVSGTNVILERGLTIENNLTISANTTLNASSNDVTIGGDFTNNGTYTTGNNTTKFTGTGNSSVNGNITFSAVEIDFDKTTDLVQLESGTIALDDLTISKGILDVGTSDRNLSGNIYIAYGEITGTNALVLNGGSQQSLQGKVGLNPNFGNISLNNGNNGLALLSDVDVSNLTFNTSGSAKVNIGKYNLTISGAISNYNINRYILANGESSGGGLTMSITLDGSTYSDEEVKLLPVGTTSGYTPIQIFANGTLSDNGYITGIPVNSAHPTFSDPTYFLDYYWRIYNEGFTTVDGDDLRCRFEYYGTINVPNYHEPWDIFRRVPWPPEGTEFYNNEWIQHGTGVKDGNDHLSFPYGNKLTKDYTFGVVSGGWFFTLDPPRTLYSRGTGGYFDRASTWSESSGGSAATAAPTSIDYCIVESGHEVTIRNRATRASQVQIDGTLVVESGARNHEISIVSGDGRLKYNGNNLITGDHTEFCNNTNSIFEYAGGSYTLPTDIDIYPNLYISGSGTKTGGNTDILVNQYLYVSDGTFNVSTNTNGDITALSDVVVNSGSFILPNNVTRTLDIEGSIHFWGSGSFNVATGGSAREHQINLEGDLVQSDGNIDLSETAYASLNFIGENSATVSRTGSGIVDFHNIEIDKPVGEKVHFTGDFNLLGDNTGYPKALDLQSGECHLGNSNINIDLTTGGTEFQIPSGTILRVEGATVKTSGNGTGIWLDGSLIMFNGGVARFDGGSGTNNNYIEYTSSGDAYLEVSNNGELYVGSQIRRSDILDVGVLDFVQSGGTITLGTYSTTADYASNRGVLELLGAGSSITQGPGDVITFANSNGSTSVPSLYFDPETSTLDASSGFTINSGNTFGIYANKNVKNITVSGAGTDAELYVLPITVEGDLTISSGTFDSKNFDVTLNGNLTNNGTFTSTNNTFYFAGSSSQTISGSGTNTFWNVEMNSGNDLILGAGVTVSNNFDLLSGSLNTQTYYANIEGNLVNNGSTSTTSGNGIVLNGTSDQQEISGTGSFAVLTINNSNGVVMPTQSSAINITSQLTLEDGVFDIGRNLMVLSSAASFDPGTTYGGNYSTSNMVQTNLSFVDAGIEKYFPVIGASTPFIYPIGSLGKFTPVVMDITSNAIGTGSIRVKAADEPHVSVPVADQGEVLQYNWTLDADGISGFTADVSMYSYDDDAVGDTAAYVTGRILLGSIKWNKYETDYFEGYKNATDISKFKFTNTDDAGIDGDYTAGGALPDQVQAFITVADGPWTTTTTWATYDPDKKATGLPGVGVPAGTGPRGAVIYVDHALTIPSNFVSSYRSVINSTGSISTGSTFGHRLGDVSGSGELILESGDLPSGVYDEFFSSAGGTINYSGTSKDYDILSEITGVNSLTISGSGTRNFANLDLQMEGNFTIEGTVDVVNLFDRTISVKEDITFNGGTFDSRYGKLTLNGTSLQEISGTVDFTAASGGALYDLEINNSGGVTLNNDLEITNGLTLTSGIVNSSSSNTLTLTNSSSSCVTGASSSSYIDGPVRKNILAGDRFDFPVGNSGRYGNVLVSNVSSTGMWEAEYTNSNPTGGGFDVDSYTGDVEYVSHNEYWRVQAPSSGETANLELRWDASSGVTLDGNFRVVRWTDLATDAWSEVSIGTTTGTSSSGTADLQSDLSFGYATGNTNHYLTFGTISVPAYTWLGNSSDWFLTTNWAGGVLPSGASDITINSASNNPIIDPAKASGVTQVNNLTIDAGATLTIMSGSQFTVNGDLVTNDDNGLVIQNTNSLPTSFIVNGSTNGNVKFEWTYGAGRFWYIGHSISNPLISSYDNIVGGSNDYKLYRYTGRWTNISKTAYDFTGKPIEGYTVKFNEQTTITHIGSLNNNAQYTRSIDRGWSLIANPFPSFIDLSDINQWNFGTAVLSIWTRTTLPGDIRGFAAYNMASGEGINGGTQYVAPGQAFYVYNQSGSFDFEVNATTKIHTSGVELKSTGGARIKDDVIRFEMNNGTTTDQSVIVFRGLGSFEMTYNDTEKRMENNGVVPNVYSLKGSKNIAINLLPEVENVESVQLGYKLGSKGAGVSTLRFTNIQDFQPGVPVYLKDHLTGGQVNLREESVYEFMAEVGTVNERFEIVFEAPISTDVSERIKGKDGIDVYAYAHSGGITVVENLLEEGEPGSINIMVTDAAGKVFHSSDYRHSGKHIIAESFTKGIYLVVITEPNKGRYTYKVNVKE